MIAELDRQTIESTATRDDYWQQSRRPLASLLFVLPLLVVYEGGVLWLGPEGVRNGADVWMQQSLALFGFGGFLLLPLSTVGILLAWHHTSGQPWRVSRRVLFGMVAESAALAACLLVVADLQARLLSLEGVAMGCQISEASTGADYVSSLVRYSGAGIYEELLFRLVLLPVTITVIGLVITRRNIKIVAALLLTSIVFAAAHYVGPHGETLEFGSFVFRSVAGGFFAILFVYRGFGIAAGTHALYDILVGFAA